MNKRLQLKFENSDKKSFSISLSEFKEGLTAEEIKAETAKIIESEALEFQGSKVAALLEANLITIETKQLV